jgi:crotonobetainyl-CoA:carnitine CoA-transferase CaiB-like acyl-CoA transferase
VADRLGVGEADVRRVRPDIVYTSVSAFGHEGYRGGYRGREELGQAVTGLQMRWFGADSPRMVFYAMNDYGAGNWAAFATMVALYHRMRTGVGQSTHASLAHTATFHQAPFMLWYEGRAWDEPTGEVAGWGTLDRIFRAADRWFYLVVHNGADRAAVREATGLFDADLRAPDAATVAALEQAFRARTAANWVSELTKRGVGAAVVVNQEESMSDEVSRTRGLSLSRRTAAGEPIRTVGLGPRLLATPLHTAALPSPPGGDLDAVLTDLGLSGEADRLIGEHAVLRELPADAEFIGRFKAGAASKT